MRDKTLKFEKYLFYFVMIDILFSPYMFFLATSYSQFFVLVWFLIKNKKEFIIKEYRFYCWILGFVLTGCFISLFTIPHDVDYYFIDNIKRGVNLWMGISYYFFFYYIFKHTDIELRKWLIAIVVYVTLWGILYYINMEDFFRIKKIFNPHDATLSIKDIVFFRFNFIWTDPNNVGYALVSIVSFLILDRKISNIFLIGIILMLLFCLLLIMSGGSIIVFCVAIPIAFLLRVVKLNNLFNLIYLMVFLLFSIYLIFEYSHIILNSDVGYASLERLGSKVGVEDSRKNIYINLLTSKNIILYLFTGEGSNIFVENRVYRSHSGHLMLIYSFGLICYFMYMYIIFRKSKTMSWMNYLPIIPFLLGFTVNIGIEELKFAAILYMIAAFIRIRCSQIYCSFPIKTK